MASRWTLDFLDGSEVKSLVLNTEPLPSWPYGAFGDFGRIGVLSTRNFVIPSTPESDYFFEYVGDTMSFTDITRRELNLNLLYDGEPVIQNAIINSLNYSNGEYKILISGKTQHIINKLSSSIQDLDLRAYEVDNSINTINLLSAQPVEITVGCTYARHLYRSTFSEYDINNLEYLAPCFKLSTLFNVILNNAGLSVLDLSADAKLSNNIYKSLAFTLFDRKLATNSFESEAYDYINYTNIIDTSVFPNNDIAFTKLYYNHFFYDDVQFMKGRAHGDVLIKHKLEITTNVGNISPYITIRDITNTVIKRTIPFTASGIYETEVTLSAGDHIWIYHGVTNRLTQHIILTWTFELVVNLNKMPISDPAIPEVGVLMPISNNLPDMSQLDLLKYIAVFNALLIDFDDETNTIIFYDYDRIIQNYEQNKFIDLTSKLVDVKKINIDRNGNFAQKNILKYSNADGVGDMVGEGHFSFLDVNTKESEVFYEAPFSVCEEAKPIGFFSKTVSVLNCVVNIPNSSKLEFLDVQSHIVLVSGGWFTNPNNICSADGTYFNDSYVRSVYSTFIESNNDLLIITCDFDLRYSDIVELTDTSNRLPVLLNYNDGKRQVNGVFLLVKINRFSDKAPTSLTLKRIGYDIKNYSFYIKSSSVSLDNSNKVQEAYNLANNSYTGSAVQSTINKRPAIEAGGFASTGQKYLNLPIQRREYDEVTIACKLNISTLLNINFIRYSVLNGESFTNSIVSGIHIDKVDVGVRLSFISNINGMDYLLSPDTATFNAMYAGQDMYIAGTFKNGLFSLYMNGTLLQHVQSAETKFYVRASYRSLYNSTFNAYFEDGTTIDNILFLDRAMSASEIANLSNT